MSNQSTVDLLFIEKEMESPYLKMGLSLALTLSLMLIWMPVPTTGVTKPKPGGNRIPYRRATLPELKPETIDHIQLTQATEPIPVPWKVENIEPEVLVEEEEIADLSTYETTNWESELNVDPPVPTGTVTLAAPGLEAPVFTRKSTPIYPRLAIKNGLQGYVILEATLTHDGLIEDISILRGLGHNRFGFEDEARKALQTWTFEPGRINDVPVNVRMVLRIDFKLS